jgi:hypothetical protein
MRRCLIQAVILIAFSLGEQTAPAAVLEPPLSGIETTIGDETITWVMKGVTNLRKVSCSDYYLDEDGDPVYHPWCYYVADFPMGLRHKITLAAEMTPTNPGTAFDQLEIIDEESGAYLTSAGCEPDLLFVAGSAFFYLTEEVGPYGVYHAYTIAYRKYTPGPPPEGTGGTYVERIKIFFHNNSPWAIPAHPEIYGGPDENEDTEFDPPGNTGDKWAWNGPGI